MYRVFQKKVTPYLNHVITPSILYLRLSNLAHLKYGLFAGIRQNIFYFRQKMKILQQNEKYLQRKWVSEFL